MKRHEALAPLSREHHGSLILAQLLKKGAPAFKGLPVDNKDKARYALEQFKQTIKKHFEKEETMLETAIDCHADIKRLATGIIEEHRQLTRLFLSMETTALLEDTMDKLGRTLEDHIRKEERELFPLLQQYCTETVLQQFYKMLQ